MIRHLLKLVWNRKRTNALMILEIFLSFLVVFLVAALGAAAAIDLRTPVGFATTDVWYVELNSGNERQWREEQIPVLDRVLRELRAMPEIEAAIASEGLPYDGNTMISGDDVDGRTLFAQHAVTTAGFDAVFGTPVVEGRWYEEADLALAWSPVVIDRDMAREFFGDEDPLGQEIPFGRFAEERRVVGIVEEFRKDGPLGNNERPSFFFELYRPRPDPLPPLPREAEEPAVGSVQQHDGAAQGTFLSKYAIRLRPGVGPEFEEELTRRVEALAPQWAVETRSLDQLRASELRLRFAPLVAAAIVAAFLLLMVGLGLIGVLWQNVTRRTRELGLRRAVGAARRQVHRQILLEVLLIATIGVALGVLAVVQWPLIDPWGLLSPPVLLSGLAGAVAVIYLLAAACGLYPSWLATRVEPAEALHYE